MPKRYGADLLLYGEDENNGKKCFDWDGEDYVRTQEIGEPVIGIHEMMAQANLITIQLGQGDVLYPTLWDDVLGLMDSGDKDLTSAISTITKNIYKRFNYFCKLYPKLLDYIKENNSTAKVAIVGTMNPIENVVISDEVLLPIGSLLNVITDSMNKKFKNWAKEYGYMYIDISNVDTPSTVEEMNLSHLGNACEMTHPTPGGYQQIARMIVSAVDKELEKDVTHYTKPTSTDIAIDLGNTIDNVTSVTLDGKLAKYSFENSNGEHLLTVTCNKKDAKSLVVSSIVTGEDDKKALCVITYSLKFDEKLGYSARRLYITHDAIKTTKTTINTVTTAIKNVTDTITQGIKTVVDKIGTGVKDLFKSIKLPKLY